MKEDADDRMQVRRITLRDGRYLIFYTFDRDTPNLASQGIDKNKQLQNKPSPQPDGGSSV
jgi:hypothetical protein